MLGSLDLAGIGASPSTSSPYAGNNQSNDFQIFLKMMTAQIKAQNPLSPMDGRDFALQLATFSGVEQQTRTNKILTEFVAIQDDKAFLQAASLIGKKVNAGESISFDGRPLELEFDIGPGVELDDLNLVIMSSAGYVFPERRIPANLNRFVWNGLDGEGYMVGDGQYKFRVQGYKDGEKVLDLPANVYSEVQKISKLGSEKYLHLNIGETISLSDVSEVR